MVGMERSILPAIAEQEFESRPRAAILSFIVVFGVTKALTNYGAGRLSDRYGRKTDPRGRMAGGASRCPSSSCGRRRWNWVIVRQRAARREPGPDLVDDGDHEDRPRGTAACGLAMGLNEFAGYVAVAASALATGWIARALRTAAAAVLPGHRLRGGRPAAVDAGDTRDPAPREPRAAPHHGARRTTRCRSARSSGAPRGPTATCRSISQAGWSTT